MTATETLRALLDGLGVEYKCGTGPANVDTVTIWKGKHGRRCFAFEEPTEGGLRVQSIVTPEQAVIATLGSGTCRMEILDCVDTENNVFEYQAECGAVVTGTPGSVNYCQGCGKEAVFA